MNLFYYYYAFIFIFLHGFFVSLHSFAPPWGSPDPSLKTPTLKYNIYILKADLNWNANWGHSTLLCCFRHLLRTFCPKQMSSRPQEMLCVSSESCSASHLGAGTYTYTPRNLPHNFSGFPLKIKINVKWQNMILFLSLSLSRYDIRIYPTFLHLHGKTFDYKIPYTTVLRLFLLPHKDQRQMFFVVSGAS